MNQAIIPVVYPVTTETETIMTRSGRLERAGSSQRYTMQGERHPVQRYSVQSYINLSMNERPNFFISRPFVRAAGLLKGNSTTEMIDVNTLSQRNPSTIRNVCIARIFV